MPEKDSAGLGGSESARAEAAAVPATSAPAASRRVSTATWVALVCVAITGATVYRSCAFVDRSLILNITHAEYVASDGSVAVRMAAHNASPTDAVIEHAQVVHVSVHRDGTISMSRMDSGKLPPFKEVVVGAGKSVIVEFATEVDLEDFYGDNLEARHQPADARADTREGRLFIEVRALDGKGTQYQNMYRIGIIGVRKRDGRFVEPYVITDTAALEVFIENGFFRGVEEGMRYK